MTNELEENIVERDFFARAEEEQRDFLAQTWCNHCMEVDLGMVNPKEFESKDRVWIEGDCVKCGHATVTEIVEEDEE
ncbi:MULTISPECIES: hypothetical protein [Marinomonas]|uniref:Uncharacterized protein n=1 Tax=Marinomonas arctica TaxID=383750 RepID=A0A7H1JAJ1_9GAMM|nr:MULTISPECIES: hypothetical protein [Marinomonas]MCS7487713.1 hypothetical protein [Marinomonas sp. BSi20414]QNT07507.1 hypothetical protein IBG28_07825 [Marinomonas arctica]GGN20424.1 hypothetical protein GCM10011350_07270 [Marinomonas arctica]